MASRRRPEPVAHLAWPQVDRARLDAQHLLVQTSPAQLEAVVRDVCGIQAQVQSSAEYAIAIRVGDARPQDVRDALWERRSLVRTWAMRGTLHLLAAKDYALWTGALQTRQGWRTGAWLRAFGVEPGEIEAVTAATDAVLTAKPIGRGELGQAIAEELGSRARPIIRERLASSWGEFLKPAAMAGVLVQGPPRNGGTTFVSPRAWLREYRGPADPDASMRWIIERYLTAYGPADPPTFASWWGVQPAEIRKRFDALFEDGALEPVEVESTFGYLPTGQASEIGALDAAPRHVRLLGGFDTFVLGYRPRDRLAPVDRTALVSRAAGWISPVVLVDGRAVGVWELRGGTGRQVTISVGIWETVDARTRRGIEAEVERVARILDVAPTLEIGVADGFTFGSKASAATEDA